jgi:hypothetical protein
LYSTFRERRAVYIRWWLEKVIAMRDSQQNISGRGSGFELDFNVYDVWDIERFATIVP